MRLSAIGRQIESVYAENAALLQSSLEDALHQTPVLRFVIDDTPTKRYGPKIEGADYHHNPTPSKTDAKLLYGHSWVVLSIILLHPTRGYISLPLKSALYIREKDIEKSGC